MSTPSTSIAAVLAVALILQMGAILQAQAPQQPDQKSLEACEVFNVALANVEAWEKYDVLLRIRQSMESLRRQNAGSGHPSSPPGVIVNRVVWRRVTLDFSARRFAFRELATSDVLVLPHDPDADPRQSRNEQVGAVIARDEDSSIAIWRDLSHFDLSPRKRFPPNFEDLLVHFSIPDLRGIWMTPEGLKTPDPWRQGQKRWQLWKSARLFQSSAVLDSGDTELRFGLSFGGREGMPAGMQWRVAFDQESLMPVSIREVHIAPANSTVPEGTEVDGPQLRLVWEETNGIQVPVALHFQAIGHHFDDGQDYPGMEYTDVDLHWFSINEPLDDSLFEYDSLRSREKVAALLDPAKTGANSLLERQPADKPGGKSDDPAQKTGEPSESDSAKNTGNAR